MRERTAPVERRLAALLWHTSFSADDLLANAAFELIVELSPPEPIADPFETDRGRDIRGLLHASPEELRVISRDGSAPIFRGMAAELILQADSGEWSFNPYKDRILRVLTGRDLNWWVDWIRQQHCDEGEHYRGDKCGRSTYPQYNNTKSDNHERLEQNNQSL